MLLVLNSADPDSMAGTMVILLAAFKATAIRDCIEYDMLQLGPHLEYLLTRWADIPGQLASPSVGQAIQWILMVDNVLRRDLQSTGGQ